ncbi:MAG TPA: nucleotide pyrophosphohydrolase [Candidatus Paceibacterota bacterium]|nr:nucleotide pyrophosphohydrolase [Candidatus Paceibacterota bacterium]
MAKKTPKDTLKDLQDKVIKFRDARDWKQFHNPKDSSIALALEAAEVMEHFLWKNPKEMEERVKARHEDIADELADVLYWVLLMCNDLDIDISEAFLRKLEKNDKKYPVSKSKGKHTKYTEL